MNKKEIFLATLFATIISPQSQANLSNNLPANFEAFKSKTMAENLTVTFDGIEIDENAQFDDVTRAVLAKRLLRLGLYDQTGSQLYVEELNDEEVVTLLNTVLKISGGINVQRSDGQTAIT